MFQKVRSVAGGVIFLLLCAGGALAMPASFQGEPEEEATATMADLPEDLELEPVEVAAEGETTDATVPDEDSDEEADEDSDDGHASHKPENHGKAVSTAANCDLKGRAKGRLVSSVARDKSATAATAQAACDAAVAAQEAAPAKTKPAEPARAAKPEKPAAAPKPAKPVQGPKEVESAEVQDAGTDAAPAAGPPAHAGPPAGKGNSKKP